jgi:uncharacterized membrane protein YccC
MTIEHNLNILKIIKDPLFIRVVSGSFFAIAFIWVAVGFFHVDMAVIWVFLAMSVLLVLLLIVVALIFSVLLRLLRRRSSGLLDAIDATSRSTSPDGEQDAQNEHRNIEKPNSVKGQAKGSFEAPSADR